MIAAPATAGIRRASPGLHGATGWGLLAAAPSILAAVLDNGIAQAFALAGAIATVTAMVMYARAVSTRIQGLSSALARASRGDLTHQQAAGRHDAIGDAIRSADAFTAMVSQIVAQVKSEAVVISFEGHAFLQRSEDLSARTEQQAAALQETAASVQELSASVSRNVGSVQQMRDMVDSVQHAAQEAQKAMVQAVGSMEGIDQSAKRTASAVAVIDDFHRSDAGFIDRDLYVVVTDRAGNYKVFGSRPEFVGKNIACVPGIDAEQFLRDAIQRADEGGGWVEYQVIHPSSNTVQDKISCFRQLGPDLLIGCGVFKSVTPTAKAWAVSFSPSKRVPS